MVVKVDLEAGLHGAQEQRPTRGPDLCNGPCFILQPVSSDFVKTKGNGADTSLHEEVDLLLVLHIYAFTLC